MGSTQVKIKKLNPIEDIEAGDDLTRKEEEEEINENNANKTGNLGIFLSEKNRFFENYTYIHNRLTNNLDL